MLLQVTKSRRRLATSAQCKKYYVNSESNRKRKAAEAEMLNWTEKRISLKEKIAASEAYMASQEDIAQVGLTLPSPSTSS